jgi:hypothetical protein
MVLAGENGLLKFEQSLSTELRYQRRTKRGIDLLAFEHSDVLEQQKLGILCLA